MLNSFNFDLLGVRVPAIIVSPYTQKGTVVGSNPKDPTTVFDHSSVLATVEERFGLKSLTQRDDAANILDIALNQPMPRLSPTDALIQLPEVAPDSVVTGAVSLAEAPSAAPGAPLSATQKTMAALALACEMQITHPDYHQALFSNYQKIVGQQDAADYIKGVESKIVARRQDTPPAP